ncbi:MAG: hypothetical protein H7Y38_17190 [Armatimonadetes bacterium]|nr:hypothetical protein [Armatimonadota bacterium]
MTPFGNLLARRLAALIARFGQGIVIRRGDSSFAASARVTVMSTATRYNYFRFDETQAWLAPAYTVTIAGDYALPTGAVVAGDVVELPTGLYPVRRVDKPRVGNVVFKTVLYVAQTG